MSILYRNTQSKRINAILDHVERVINFDLGHGHIQKEESYKFRTPSRAALGSMILTLMEEYANARVEKAVRETQKQIDSIIAKIEEEVKKS